MSETPIFDELIEATPSALVWDAEKSVFAWRKPKRQQPAREARRNGK